MSAPLLSGKVFLLVTGASRGIGKQITESFATLLGNGSVVLLIARNENGLKETAQKLPKSLSVHTASMNLSVATADELKDVVRKALGSEGATQFEKAIIIHNAGSLGDVSKPTNDMKDLTTWRNYYDLNVFSPAILNGVFMEFFNEDTKVTRLVINITSLCGIQPSKSLAYYCTGKAAREMFFKVFALENPEVNVLNYSPGPVETDMQQVLRKNLGDADGKKMFNDFKASGSVLTTEQTVNRLIEILKLQNYKSGDHVDYYDK
ncbi:sepiapterin reductase-like [Neodiprion pinetum]|uniref:sepiapterin reductase-like n=1 Tax=Neodiprion pinetum TaxID=441929 RepID=UPI001EDEC1AC|nr:sepiapterin reductase-like isoform X1 [Neodiprion pinetum]XP_046480481.1 sepiapterin reductase-like isoform X1 [Neodiprion pinetum]XP_046615408.1 sepiapterin reductase-like [Neodiprion virginianus]